MPVDTTEQPTDPSLTELFYHSETVRFVYWRRFSGVKFTVAMVAIVTVVSFVTGLSALSQEELIVRGPIGEFFPQILPVVQFGGVLFGFLLAVVTLGLRRQKRVAWVLGVLALPLLIVIPLASLQSTHIPLLGLIVVTFPLLIYNRAHFEASLNLTSLQLASLGSIVGVLAYGTIGSYAMRDQFIELHTWTDSAYYVLVTIATVGYGDITPTTAQAKWFSLSVIIFGTGAFTAAIGALVIPAIEKRMASAVGNIKPSELSLMEDHILVLGYSDITDSLIHQLTDTVDVIVVTADPDEAALIDDRDINVLTGDPTDEAVLSEAAIEYARGIVVATRNDANDVLAILAARTLNPDVRIVAAANEPRNARKLNEVGADEVISPSDLGGILLGKSILEETALEDLINRLTSTDEE